MSSTIRNQRSRRRVKASARASSYARERTTLQQLPPISTSVIPFKIRYEVDTSGRFTVYGSDAAKWVNICTIPGAFTVQPLFSTIKIKSITGYGTADIPNAKGGTIGLQFCDDATSLSGWEVASPVIQYASAPMSAGFSKVKISPKPGSVQYGWFNPNVVNTSPIFAVDTRDSQTSYIDVSFVGAIRNPEVDTGTTSAAAAWIWGVLGPTAVNTAGTIVVYPLAAAVAAQVVVPMYPFAY